VPPSVLPMGAYRWADGMALDVAPKSLAEPPAWLVEQLDRSGPNSTRAAIQAPAENPIPSGQRNNTLSSLAGTMRRAGMSQAEILAAIRQANADRCVPPLPDHEVERIATSIGRYKPDEISVALVENHWAQMFASGQVRFPAVTSKELAEQEYDLTYLVDGLLVRGQPGVIAGPKKTLKTNISIDLAISLSHAGLFLGRFNVPEPVRVGLMSGESGAATIQETAKRIAQAKGERLEDFANVVWSFEVPQLGNQEHAAALRQFITEHALAVLILDPTYLMMMGLGNDAGNLFIVGSFLKGLAELSQETGCTVLLCHHLRKNVAEPYEPAQLEDIAWAGFQEFVRQWILLNRRVKYDPDQGGHHELWMSVGGSAGHSGLWGLNIDEGTRQDAGGRRWDVEAISASEVYAERAAARCDAAEQRKQRQQDSRQERQRQAVFAALRRFPDGETPRVLRQLAGVSGAVAEQQLALLVEEGIAVECTVRKNTREERAFKLRRGGGTGGTGGTVPPVPPGAGGGGTGLYI